MQRVIAIVLVLVLAATSGCTSLQGVSLALGGAPVPSVNVGDRVVVTRKDGERAEFQVTAVEADALVGKTRIAYEDMAMLEVKRPDLGKTMAVVAVAIGVVLLYTAAKGATELGNFN